MRRQALHERIHDGEHEHGRDHDADAAESIVGVFADRYGYGFQPNILPQRRNLRGAVAVGIGACIAWGGVARYAGRRYEQIRKEMVWTPPA